MVFLLSVALVTPYSYISINCTRFMNELLKSSLSNYGEYDMKYKGIISEENYYFLNFRTRPSDRGYMDDEVIESYDFTVHIVVHDFEHATANIRYSYKLVEKNGTIINGGSSVITVKMEYIDSRWIIISVYEEP